MATHRRRRKTVSSSGRVFSQENQRATWKKKKEKKILGGLRWKEDRKRERERKREAIKQPRSRPFAAPYIAIKCFRRGTTREKQVIFMARIFINRNKNSYFLLNDICRFRSKSHLSKIWTNQSIDAKEIAYNLIPD